MAESVVLATAWFTVRMICQVSYKAIKSFRATKKRLKKSIPEATKEAFSLPAGGGGGGRGGGSHGYVPAVSAEDEANDESCVPWGPVACSTAEPSSQASGSLRDDDRLWVEELRRAANSSTHDNLRLLRELQELGDKIANMPLENLYDNLRHAMKLLLEYQQRPQYWGAHKTLQQAEEAANYVYNNERSLVMSLSALRLRIVITYLLHRPMDSKGEPGMDDKKEDKEQCELYISNALKQGLLVSLCRKFLESRDSQDSELRQRVERETVLAFDILLEVMASVHLLEPFMPSQGPVPEDAPAIVVHALSIYCESALGSSHVYADLARALKDWESTPERLEKWALYCLYKSTGGPGWACNKGWNSLFDTGLASLYGVSTAGGRVTKISLGANNLEGHLPLELRNFENLQELSLPGNKLCGKVPAELWSLPCLQVVALHGNRFTVTPPPEIFSPAACISPTGPRNFTEPARRRLGLAGMVVALEPSRMEVYLGESFVCSWRITNIGSVAFKSGTRLTKGNYHSRLGGASHVQVNPLEPGEEQTVSVMLQAPTYETWEVQDEWALIGESIDFVDEDEAKAKTPTIRVIPRPAGGGKPRGEEASLPTLANAVFIARSRSSRGASQFMSNSSHHQHFHHSDQYSPRHHAHS